MRKLIERLDVALFVVKVWIVNASRRAYYAIVRKRWAICESCGYCAAADDCQMVVMRGGRWENHCRPCVGFTRLARVVTHR